MGIEHKTVQKLLQFHDTFLIEKQLQPVTKNLRQLYETETNNPHQ